MGFLEFFRCPPPLRHLVGHLSVPFCQQGSSSCEMRRESWDSMGLSGFNWILMGFSGIHWHSRYLIGKSLGFHHDIDGILKEFQWWDEQDHCRSIWGNCLTVYRSDSAAHGRRHHLIQLISTDIN